MCHAHARPCLSTGWALNRRFGLTSGTAAVLAQGGGGVYQWSVHRPRTKSITIFGSLSCAGCLCINFFACQLAFGDGHRWLINYFVALQLIVFAIDCGLHASVVCPPAYCLKHGGPNTVHIHKRVCRQEAAQPGHDAFMTLLSN